MEPTPPILVALVLAFVLGGCGERRRELREWRPSDHTPPPGAATDDPAPSQDPDPAETERRAADALFRAMCAGCHGERGRGDGPHRPAGNLPDLGSAAWQEQRSDAQIADAIAAGRGVMPGFAERLSPAGIEALVRHVRRLGAREGPSGDPVADTTPPGPHPSAEDTPGGGP